MKHGNDKHERRRRFVRMCEVKAYIAPARMVQIAAERTDGMANYFLIADRERRDFADDVRTLCRSAYMQAVHDMLYAIESGATPQTRTGEL